VPFAKVTETSDFTLPRREGRTQEVAGEGRRAIDRAILFRPLSARLGACDSPPKTEENEEVNRSFDRTRALLVG
jgi:hypothetical protein